MSNKVGLHEAGCDVIPVGEGADGDLALEQASRVGERTPLTLVLFPFPCQKPVDRRRAHRMEPIAYFLSDLQFAKIAEKIDQRAEKGDESLAAQAIEQVPKPYQYNDNVVVIDWRPPSSLLDSSFPNHKDCWLSIDDGSDLHAPMGKHPCGIFPVVSCGCDHLVKNLTLLSFSGFLVACVNYGDYLETNTHWQLHDSLLSSWGN